MFVYSNRSITVRFYKFVGTSHPRIDFIIVSSCN